MLRGTCTKAGCRCRGIPFPVDGGITSRFTSWTTAGARPRSADDDFISDVKAKVRQAAEALRTGYAAYRADAEEVRILRLSWHVHGRLSRGRGQLTRNSAAQQCI